MPCRRIELGAVARGDLVGVDERRFAGPVHAGQEERPADAADHGARELVRRHAQADGAASLEGERALDARSRLRVRGEAVHRLGRHRDETAAHEHRDGRRDRRSFG